MTSTSNEYLKNTKLINLNPNVVKGQFTLTDYFPYQGQANNILRSCYETRELGEFCDNWVDRECWRQRFSHGEKAGWFNEL